MTDTPAKTVLLTLGRLPIALDLARSFDAAGWRVLVADPFAMHLARMSRAVSRSFQVTPPADDAAAFLDDLRTIVVDHDVTLVVPISEESMHVAALRDMLPVEVSVFGAAQTQTLALHDKLAFVRLAERAGVAVPDSARFGDEAAHALIERGDVVIKPRFSCSGRGVHIVRHGQPLPNLDADEQRGALVQACMPGALCSSFSLARNGNVLVTVVYRAVVLSGSVAVCFERVDPAAAIGQWVDTFVESVRHTGFIAFDFIVDDAGQPQAIECNPRATSGIHFVDTASLAAGVSGMSTAPLPLRPQRLLQEFYSCFTATLGATLRRDQVAHHWRSLGRADDVSWSARDPWPFLLMSINTWPLISRALRSGHTFAEVAALDIEWRAGDRDYATGDTHG